MARTLHATNRRTWIQALVLLAILLGETSANADIRIVFPEDDCVINVKRDFGAVGDGKTDDTKALQSALDAGSGAGVKQHKIVYLPNGIYRIRETLVVNRGQQGAGLGPWLYGESRDGVVTSLEPLAENYETLTAIWQPGLTLLFC